MMTAEDLLKYLIDMKNNGLDLSKVELFSGYLDSVDFPELVTEFYIEKLLFLKNKGAEGFPVNYRNKDNMYINNQKAEFNDFGSYGLFLLYD